MLQRVSTYDDLNIIANDWKPQLTKVSTLEAAADNINFPHEDYPEFVDNTAKAITETINWLKEGSLKERDIKMIHQICMEGKEYMVLGTWRKIGVVVSNSFAPPEPFLIPSMMMSILPVGTDSISTIDEAIEWYKTFETIHPFEDGNGRVGGVLLAAISYLLTGEYTVSKMEFKYFIDPMINTINDIDSKVLNKYFEGTHEEKVKQYLLSKSVGAKFKRILELTNNFDQFDAIVNNAIDIESVTNYLNKLKDYGY